MGTQRLLAAIQAVAIHVVFGVVIFFGLDFASPKVQPHVPLRIQASVVAPAQVEEMRERETEKLREEAAERRREEQRRAEQQRQADEKRRQEQAAEARRREEAAAALKEKQDLAARERQLADERQKQIEELRAERERLEQQRKEQEAELQRIADQRRKEEEDKARRLEEERQQQLMDLENQQMASAERVSLEQQYFAAIQLIVMQSWRRPPTAQPGLKCRVRVDQTPGGNVVSAQVMTGCAADEVVKRSIVEAIYRAEPLPYKGFEDVFRRTFIFEFQYDG